MFNDDDNDVCWILLLLAPMIGICWLFIADGERGLFTGGDDDDDDGSGGGDDGEDTILFAGNNDGAGGGACAGWYWDGSCVVLK